MSTHTFLNGWIPVAILAAAWVATSITARYWWRQAQYDQLTGLPGRTRLAARTRRATLVRRGRVGVLLLDVDGFKQINDTHGHRTGDGLLKALAARLRDASVRGELAIRLHGDEFALWLGPCTPQHAQQRAADVAAALARPLVLDLAEPERVVTASVGHATAEARTAELGALLHAADQSMYAAKRDRATASRLPTADADTRLRDTRKDIA